MMARHQQEMGPARQLYGHSDVVTSISVSGADPRHVISTSLDGAVIHYDLSSELVLQEMQAPPVLDSAWADYHFYIGCVDGSVRYLDFETNKVSAPVGKLHEKGVNCLKSTGDGFLVSGSWDKTVQVIDLKTQESQLVALPEKVVALDTHNGVLVVAMTNRLIHVYDLTNLALIQKRESGLQYQIRSVSCFSKGFAATSIEGKVSLEYYTNAGNYAFRCHREKDVVNSVNCCQAVQDDLLYTAGDDGRVVKWNHVAKKKLETYTIGQCKIARIVIHTQMGLLVAADHHVYLHTF